MAAFEVFYLVVKRRFLSLPGGDVVVVADGGCGRSRVYAVDDRCLALFMGVCRHSQSLPSAHATLSQRTRRTIGRI